MVQGPKLLIAAMLCLFGVTCALAGTVVPLSFNGTVTCSVGTDCTNFVAPGNYAVTGSYSLDTSSDAVVGSWSFNTPYGTISSSDANALVFKFTPPPAGFDDLVFCVGYNISSCAVDFAMVITPFETNGSVSDISHVCQPDLLGAACVAALPLVSGTVSPQGSSTPEPASLPLVGSGVALLYLRFRQRK